MTLRLVVIASAAVWWLGALCAPPKAVNPQALAQEQACVENLQAGDYDAAKTHCEICLEYDETVPECINGLGIVAFSKGDDDAAIRQFTKAVKMSENFAQARNNLGAVYFKQGRFDEAVPFFEAAVRIDPGYSDARYNYALSYLRIGQAALAKNDLKKANKNFDLAIEQYQKLVALFPNYANGYRDMGLIAVYRAGVETDADKKTSLLTKADGFFDNCLKVDSTNESCHQSFGQVLLTQNQYDQALYHFVQCLAANKTNSDCLKGMDLAYQGSQVKGQALAQYVQRLKKNPNDPQGHYGYCVALFQQGLSQMAVAECQAAIKLDAKQCLAYYQLAMYYKKVLNAEQALANCKSFLLCDPNQKDQDKVAQCQKVITSTGG